jgi:predicted NBD/HSP70 family sugar kinase
VNGGSGLRPEDVALAAVRGDPLGISLIQQSAMVVGESLAALVNTFNPAVIVLGGAIAGDAGEIFLFEVENNGGTMPPSITEAWRGRCPMPR